MGDFDPKTPFGLFFLQARNKLKHDLLDRNIVEQELMQTSLPKMKPAASNPTTPRHECCTGICEGQFCDVEGSVDVDYEATM